MFLRAGLGFRRNGAARVCFRVVGIVILRGVRPKIGRKSQFRPVTW